MSKRVLCLFALAVIPAMTVMLAGCPPKEDPARARAGAPPVVKAPGDGDTDVAATPDKVYKIGFSNATFEDPWREVQNKEMELEADKHPGIELVILDGENATGKQIETVKSFMQQEVDLLVISPIKGEPLTPVVTEAAEEMPVITIDRNVTEPVYRCFIGGNNVTIGKAAAEMVVEHFGDRPAKIVEIEGVMGATATTDRHDGFHEVISEHPDLEVVFGQPGDYKRAPAQEAMAAALKANDQIDCVYAHNDEMALGAYQAAKAAKREDEMIIIGIDGIQTEAIKAVMDGNMHATFFYPTCGKEAIQYALKILEGEEVDQDIELETTAITADNAADYYDPDTTLVIQG